MHIGLIGGIGPAATEFYYRALVKLYSLAERQLDLTIVTADASELVRNMEAGASAVQAAVFARYVDQLKAGGCEAVAVTSMGGHFCIKNLIPVSSLPIISALTALENYLSVMGVKRIGVLGTRAVMESRLYGLAGVEVVSVPADELPAAHENYIAMAVSGRATHEQRTFFEKMASWLIDRHGAEAIVLGGTDLFLAFDQPNYPYRVVNCAQVHAEEIARVGLGGLSNARPLG